VDVDVDVDLVEMADPIDEAALGRRCESVPLGNRDRWIDLDRQVCGEAVTAPAHATTTPPGRTLQVPGGTQALSAIRGLWSRLER